jgi:hypothetical protein
MRTSYKHKQKTTTKQPNKAQATMPDNDAKKTKAGAAAKTRSGGSNKNNAKPAGNDESIDVDVNAKLETLRTKVYAVIGKNAELNDDNITRDENITDLIERVDALEKKAEERTLDSLDDAIKNKMNNHVTKEELAERIISVLSSDILRTQVDAIVKSILGHKGKDGIIVSTGQLCERGRLKNLKELQDDVNRHYRVVINKYVWKCLMSVHVVSCLC